MQQENGFYACSMQGLLRSSNSSTVAPYVTDVLPPAEMATAILHSLATVGGRIRCDFSFCSEADKLISVCPLQTNGFASVVLHSNCGPVTVPQGQGISVNFVASLSDLGVRAKGRRT